MSVSYVIICAMDTIRKYELKNIKFIWYTDMFLEITYI